MTIIADRPDTEPQTRFDTLRPALADADPADRRAVLLHVWDGLVAARLAGLLAATTAERWRKRQAHAEAVEFDLALQLAQTCTVASGRGIPARLPEPVAIWTAPRAAKSVTAILSFCDTAEAKLREAGDLVHVWEDSLLGHVALTCALADCWRGHHTGPLLRLPSPPPPWWR